MFPLITLPGTSTIKTQPTNILDYFIFIWCLIVTFSQTFSLCIYIYKKNTYSPLRVRNFTYIYLCYIFGLVNIWSTFISNSHFETWNTFKGKSCVFWTYWMVYFFGYAMFYFFLIQHIVGIAYKEYTQWKLWSVRIFFLLYIIVFPLILFTIITIQDASYFDEHINTCNSHIEYKIILIMWIVMSIFLMFIMVIIMYMNNKTHYSDECRSLTFIIIIFCIIVVCNIPINILGLLQYYIGRCVYTFNVALLHLIFHFKLIGYRIYKSLLNDDKYKKMILSSSEVDEIDINTVKDIVHIRQMLEGFLSHLDTLKPERLSTRDKQGKMSYSISKYNPSSYVYAYRQISSILEDYERMDQQIVNVNKQTIIDRTKTIVLTHFSNNCDKPIFLNNAKLSTILPSFRDTVVPRDIYEQILDDILDTMDREWGRKYMSNSPKIKMSLYITSNVDTSLNK